MVYQIRLKPEVGKKLNKLPKKDQSRIYKAFYSLSRKPQNGKKLSGEYKGFYSYKVWPYRIIYAIIKKELLIIIVKVGHRQGVY